MPANRAIVLWIEEGGGRLTEARIVDVSDEGLQLEFKAAPGLSQSLWLHLVEPIYGSRIGGQVMWREGTHRLGLRLYGRCPLDITCLATTGLGLGATRPNSMPSSSG